MTYKKLGEISFVSEVLTDISVDDAFDVNSANPISNRHVAQEFNSLSSNSVLKNADNAISGNISISKTLTVGDSRAQAANSFSAGSGCIAGCKAFSLTGKDDEQQKYFLKSVAGIRIGMTYSIFYSSPSLWPYQFGNRDMLGHVVAIDENENSVQVDSYWAGDVERIQDSYIWFPDHPTAEGGDIVVGSYSSATGYECKSSQIGAHAEGIYSVAAGKYSHAEGYDTYASYAAHAEGYETSALGQNCHSEGKFTVAGRSLGESGRSAGSSPFTCAHAEGRSTKALGQCSHSAGISAETSADYSYVWNGDSTVKYEVLSSETGTFNVNPRGGAKGFRVGVSSLNDYLRATSSETYGESLSASRAIAALAVYAKPDVIDYANSIYVSGESYHPTPVYQGTSPGYYIDVRTGELVEYNSAPYMVTELIDIKPGMQLTATYSSHYSTAGYALYDENGKALGAYGYNAADPAEGCSISDEVFTFDKIVALDPRARKIRFGKCSGGRKLSANFTYVELNTVPTLISSLSCGNDALAGEIRGLRESISGMGAEIDSVENAAYAADVEIGDAKFASSSVVRKNATLSTGQYIYRVNGMLIPYGGYRFIVPIEVTKDISITASYMAQYSTAGWAIYNGDFTSAVWGGYDSDDPSNAYYSTNEVFTYQRIIDAMPDAKWICFGNGNPSDATLPKAQYDYHYVDPLSSYICSANEKSDYLMDMLPTEAKYCRTVEWSAQTIQDYLLNRTTGTMQAYNGALITEFIDIGEDPFAIFRFSGTARWDTCGYAVYDKQQNFIASYGYNVDDPNVQYTVKDMIIDAYQIQRKHGNAKYVRFGSLNASKFSLEKTELMEFSDIANASNVLYKKRYAIIGDSFTYDSETVRSYGTILAERNSMDAKNYGVSGSKMTWNGQASTSAQSFAYGILPSISGEISSVDYMTICYGLNEGTVDAGSREDTGYQTVWGAWNNALSNILRNNPAVKLGIIIADSWMNAQMHDTLSSIGRWWGIPVLDLKNDPGITPMIDGRLDGSTLNPFAKEMRNSAFKKSESDGHPTQKAQEFRSTIIENFMRSL